MPPSDLLNMYTNTKAHLKRDTHSSKGTRCTHTTTNFTGKIPTGPLSPRSVVSPSSFGWCCFHPAFLGRSCFPPSTFGWHCSFPSSLEAASVFLLLLGAGAALGRRRLIYRFVPFVCPCLWSFSVSFFFSSVFLQSTWHKKVCLSIVFLRFLMFTGFSVVFF